MREKRHAPRIPLENMLYLSTVNTGRELPSVLLDISVSGARIGLPPAETLPSVGSEVIFKNTSLLAPLLENRKTTVIWAIGVQFGVCFTQQLAADIESIADLLQTEIFY